MVREATQKEKIIFDSKATHPLQTWAWGDFRKSHRVEVVRLIEYTKNKKILATFQITFHHLPYIPFTFGYCPKSTIPSLEVLMQIKKIARSKKAIMVKFEPNILEKDGLNLINNLRKKINLVKGRPLFTKYTFWLNLKRTEFELLAQMKSKTRYNLKLAQRKGVKVIEDSSAKGFTEYWRLTKETTARQGFYAHDYDYHQKMWQTLGGENGFAHLLKAVYQGKTLVTWIIFLLNEIAYYPYGASSNEHREVMASNLMMWEAIKFAKKNNYRLFDMWGSTGPNPAPNDPWLGFHRFKEGFGAHLVEFVGTYDLIINQFIYWPYRLGELLRWRFLRLIK